MQVTAGGLLAATWECADPWMSRAKTVLIVSELAPRQLSLQTEKVRVIWTELKVLVNLVEIQMNFTESSLRPAVLCKTGESAAKESSRRLRTDLETCRKLDF